MKFAEGGVIEQPVILGDDSQESIVADCHLGELYKLLALDALLLELEGQDIVIDGKSISQKLEGGIVDA